MGLMKAVGPEIISVKTMKLEGKLSEVLVVVLIDSKTSHNFTR